MNNAYGTVGPQEVSLKWLIYFQAQSGQFVCCTLFVLLFKAVCNTLFVLLFKAVGHFVWYTLRVTVTFLSYDCDDMELCTRTTHVRIYFLSYEESLCHGD